MVDSLLDSLLGCLLGSSLDFSLVADDTDPPAVAVDDTEAVLVDERDSVLLTGGVGVFGDSSFSFLKSLGTTVARYLASESLDDSLVVFADSLFGGGGNLLIAGTGAAISFDGANDGGANDGGGCADVNLSSSRTSLSI